MTANTNQPASPSPGAPEVEEITNMRPHIDTLQSWAKDQQMPNWAQEVSEDWERLEQRVTALSDSLRVAREERDAALNASRLPEGFLLVQASVWDESRSQLAALRRTQEEDTRDAERWRALNSGPDVPGLAATGVPNLTEYADSLIAARTTAPTGEEAP